MHDYCCHGLLIFTGPATPEVIESWHHLTHTPALNLTKEEIQEMGISTDSVQYPEKYGGVSASHDNPEHVTNMASGISCLP